MTRGTGRFLGATGVGTIEGRADFNQGTFVITLAGGIVLADQNTQ